MHPCLRLTRGKAGPTGKERILNDLHRSRVVHIQARLCQTLRDFLTAEWREKNGEMPPRVFSHSNMPGSAPKVRILWILSHLALSGYLCMFGLNRCNSNPTCRTVVSTSASTQRPSSSTPSRTSPCRSPPSGSENWNSTLSCTYFSNL